MRILFISNLYPPVYVGGYELNCYEVALGLRERGHDVHVLTSSLRTRHLPATEERVYRRLTLKTDFGLADARSAPWLARNKVAAQWYNMRVTRSVVHRLRPDVAMVWNGLHLGRSVFPAVEERVPVVYYLQDPWLAQVLALQRREQQSHLRWTVRRAVLALMGSPSKPIAAKRLVYCSHALREQYERSGVRPERSEVVHLGISTEAFPLQPQHIIHRAFDEPFRVLYIGQVTPEKGVSTLISALGRLRAMAGVEQTRLTVLGSARNEAFLRQVEALVRELGLESAVTFLPPRPRSELPAVFREHDVLAFTSEWEEPFGLSLVEAMSVGLPVVSTTLGGPAEIVRHAENALAFRAGDPQDLADKLAHLLLHPEEAARMGRTAAQDVRQRFTIERQVDQLEQYLLSLEGENRDLLPL